MSWTGGVDLTWGGEKRRFRLAIKDLIAIEEETGTGIIEAMRLIAMQQAKLPVVRAVIKYGLEGGGLSPNMTAMLIDRYFDDGGPDAIIDHYVIAIGILEPALTLPRELQDDDAGKPTGGGTNEADASPSP